MVPLDSAVAQQDALSPVNQTLRGERLTVESDDRKWPLRRTVLFVVLTSAVLWSGIFFALGALF
jgi:hypothetical protein